MNIGKKFSGAFGEDGFGVEEVEDGPVRNEQKPVDPLVQFLPGGAHAPSVYEYSAKEHDTFLASFIGVVLSQWLTGSRLAVHSPRKGIPQ